MLHLSLVSNIIKQFLISATGIGFFNLISAVFLFLSYHYPKYKKYRYMLTICFLGSAITFITVSAYYVYMSNNLSPDFVDQLINCTSFKSQTQLTELNLSLTI